MLLENKLVQPLWESGSCLLYNLQFHSQYISNRNTNVHIHPKTVQESSEHLFPKLEPIQMPVTSKMDT